MLGRRRRNGEVGQTSVRNKKLWHECAECRNGHYENERPAPARVTRHEVTCPGGGKLRGRTENTFLDLVRSEGVGAEGLEPSLEAV